MASLRAHTRIARSPEEVWTVVSDAGAISTWFPSIEKSSVSGSTRSCELAGGVPLVEEIITSDPQLRRFQYRIVGGGVPVNHHLGTVDVLEDQDGSLVVYSTEVTPDELAGQLGPAVEEGLQGLKAHLERA
jgi:uncharacterized protein YndB with AHSA1/START domain